MAVFESFPVGQVEVRLDGLVIEIPPDRRSFTGIRSYLESLALQNQRVLCSLCLDGEPVNLTEPHKADKPFTEVEAETMGLDDVPLQLVKAARQQATHIQSRLKMAVELVLINEPEQARELWWHLSSLLKEPLLTLSLLPENICGPENGRASLMQLRKWQLEQLGRVMARVETACAAEDTTQMSEALEQHAVPWVESLLNSIELWHETLSSAARAPRNAA